MYLILGIFTVVPLVLTVINLIYARDGGSTPNYPRHYKPQRTKNMEAKILKVMGIIVLIGLVTQGIFGIAFGITLSAIIGIIFGLIKRNKPFILWSSIALAIALAGITTFIVLLVNSNM